MVARGRVISCCRLVGERSSPRQGKRRINTHELVARINAHAIQKHGIEEKGNRFTPEEQRKPWGGAKASSVLWDEEDFVIVNSAAFDPKSK